MQPSKVSRKVQMQHCPREGTGVLKRAAPRSAAKPASNPASDMFFFVGLHPGQTAPMAVVPQAEKGAQTAFLHKVIRLQQSGTLFCKESDQVHHTP